MNQFPLTILRLSLPLFGIALILHHYKDVLEVATTPSQGGVVAIRITNEVVVAAVAAVAFAAFGNESLQLLVLVNLSVGLPVAVRHRIYRSEYRLLAFDHN